MSVRSIRRMADRMEKHLQTVILAILTALIIWVGGTVTDNRDGITRLNVTVENILNQQNIISKRIDDKADKTDIQTLSNENARQWADVKMNNQARQSIKFIERDIEEIKKRLDELKEHIQNR